MPRPNPTLRFAALFCSGAAAFILLWSIVPPVHAFFWIVSIIATEWGLWLGLLGLIGAILGVILLRRKTVRDRRAGLAAVSLGVASAGVSLLPLAQTLPVARENGVTLSLSRYLWDDHNTGSQNQRSETETYATVSGQKLQLDIHRASAERFPGLRPALIVVHGGSWRAGNRSDFAHWDRFLTAQGYTVFDIDYRVRPQPNFHSATGDVKAAVGWVSRNASRYSVDPHRLCLLGRSAGGHLALLAAYTTGNPNLPPSDGAPDTPVQAVVSFYGPADLVWGYYHPAVPDIIDGPGVLRHFLGGSPEAAPDAYQIASPINYAGTHPLPPTLLLHGERDVLVGPQHTRRLSARLAAAGQVCETVYFPYAVHGYDFHRSGWGGQVSQAVLLKFLAKHTGR